MYLLIQKSNSTNDNTGEFSLSILFTINFAIVSKVIYT